MGPTLTEAAGLHPPSRFIQLITGINLSDNNQTQTSRKRHHRDTTLVSSELGLKCAVAHYLESPTRGCSQSEHAKRPAVRLIKSVFLLVLVFPLSNVRLVITTVYK